MRPILDTQEKIEYYKASLAAMDKEELLKWEHLIRSCMTEDGITKYLPVAPNPNFAPAFSRLDVDLIMQISVASHPYVQDEINNRGLQPL